MTKLDPDWPVFEAKGEDDNGRATVLDVRDFDSEPITDRDGREYEYVDAYLENEDFYQGLSMTSIIRRKSDGKLFGYFYWDDISKHGESFVESNGDEYGLECDTSADDFDWDDYVSYYVWVPVEEFSITGYRPAVDAADEA